MPIGLPNKKIVDLYNLGGFEQIEAALGFDIRNLIVDYVANVTGQELCNKYRIKSYTTIWKLMKALSVQATRIGRNGHCVPESVRALLADYRWLNCEYATKSAVQIATELEVTPGLVKKALVEHKIPIRDSRQATLLAAAAKNDRSSLCRDRDWLTQRYVTERKATAEIAAMIGVSPATILSWLKHHGIQVRTDGWHQIKGHADSIYSQLQDKQWLTDKYIIDGLSSTEIANGLGCTPELIQRYLRRYGIKARSAHYYESVRKPSSAQLCLAKYLDEAGVPHTSGWIYDGVFNRKPRHFELDEYLPDHRTFIEVQGEHWHGLDRRHWRYQRVRAKLWADLMKFMCLRRDYPDYRIVYLAKHQIDNGEWYNKLFPAIRTTGARHTECNFVSNDVAVPEFIITHHYLHTVRPGRAYGLYHCDKLVAGAVVSSPSRQSIRLSNKRVPAELSRLVAVNAPHNSLSWFLSRIIKFERRAGLVAGLISFADQSPVRKGEHSGAVYRAANFRHVGMTEPSYFYVDKATEPIHKKTVYNRAKKIGLTEREFVLVNGLYKLPEWPKHRFEFLF